MGTDLQEFVPTQSTMSFVKEFGAAIAKSKMFGCENESQGQVFAMACIAGGRDPLSIPEDYHLMHGRLTLRADAMLGRLSKAGGNYVIVEHGSEAAEIEVEYRGRMYRERFTWDEAKQEPFVYAGKTAEVAAKMDAGKWDELKLTSNYATPRRRSQHLWARVVSDAVRVVAPELVTGSYTPEEVANFGENGHSRVALPANVVVECVSPVGAAPEVDEVVVDKLATDWQVGRILKLFESLGVPQQDGFAILKKRGAGSIKELTSAQAEELIGSLDAMAGKVASKPTTKSDTEYSQPNDGPIDSEFVTRIQAKIKELVQLPGGGDLPEKIRTKLAGKKIADLTHASGELLYDALCKKTLELFFSAALNFSADKEASQGNESEEIPY